MDGFNNPNQQQRYVDAIPEPQVIELSNESAPSAGATVAQSIASEQRKMRKKLLTVGIAPMLAVMAAILFLTAWQVSTHRKNSTDQQTLQNSEAPSNSIDLSKLPNLSTALQRIDEADQIVVNGKFVANGALILTPTVQPSSAAAGQLYFDRTTGGVRVFDGTEFKSLVSTTDGQTICYVGSDCGFLAPGDVTGLTLPQDLGVSDAPTFAGLTLSSDLSVSNGGSGRSSFGSNSVLLGNGTGPLLSTNAPVAGQFLAADAGGVPQFVSLSGDVTVSPAGVITINTDTVGASELVSTGVVAGTYGDGANYPVFTVDADGRISSVSSLALPGGGGGVGSLNTLTGGITLAGTANQVSVVTGGSTITLSTPQDIASTSSPTFAGLNLSTPLTVGNGGTGATTASGARTNLGAAASGANSDITSLSGLTTALTAGQGGTGATTAQGAINNLSGLTANGDILYFNGSNTTRLPRGTNGQCLVSNATTILWSSCAGTGTTFFTIQGTSGTPQSVNGGDTITIAAGTNISTTAGATDTVTVSVVNNPTFSGLVTLQAGASISAGQSFTINGEAFTDLTGTGLTISGGSLQVTLGTSIDLTSEVTGVLPIANGGTNANNASTARSNLGAAASGANGDITSLSGLTTALSVSQGGTGTTTLGSNGVLVGNGTSAITSVVAGGAGLCLISNAGAPSWQACPGSGGVASVNTLTGALTIQGTTNQVNVGTAGSTITLSTPQDIAVSSSPTFSGLTLTSLTLASDTVTDITGTGLQVVGGALQSTLGTSVDLTSEVTGVLPVANGGTNANNASSARTNLGAAASGANGDITSTTALNTITPSSSLTVGATSQAFTLQGTAASTITATGNGFTTSVGFSGVATAAVTYNFDRTAGAGTYTICTTAGNCSGVGGGVTTAGGTNNRIAKFTGAQTLGDSSITDNGSTVSITTDFVVQGAGGATFGQASTTTGKVVFQNSTNANSITIQSGVSASNLTFTLPTSDGVAGECLKTDSFGVLSFGSCLSGSGGGSGGVVSVNGLSGTLSIANASAAGSTITINDATTAAKGIASFNSTNFSVTSGAVNTVQDIAASSSPSFAGLSVTGASGVTVGTGSATGLVVFRDGSSAFTSSVTTNTLTGNRNISLPNASGTVAVSASGNIALDAAGNISFTGQLPISSGGTGASTQQGALNALSGLTTNGDIVYYDGSNTTRLPRGTNGQCLVSNATTILWSSCAGTGTTFFTIQGTSGTPQSVNGGDTITIAAGTNISTTAGATDTVTVSVVNNPTFSGLVTLQAGASISAGQSFTINGEAFTDLTGTGLSFSGGALQATLGTSVDLTSEVTGTLPVGNGGTGATTLASNGVLVGNGTSAITSVTAGGTGLCLISTAGAPSWQACPGSGGIASLNTLTGALTIQGTADQVIVNDNGTDTITLSLPQSLAATSSPTFNNLTLTNLTVNGDVFSDLTGSGLQINAGSLQATLGTSVDLTSEVTGVLPIANGGTNANNASSARTNLGAAASGANGDITSTTALNTITPSSSLTVGATTQAFTLQGTGTSVITATSTGNTTTVGFVTPTSNATINFPALGAGTYTVCTTSGNCLGGGGGGANTSLSNLTSVAINTSLLSGATNIDLGSGSAPFRDLYLGGTSTNNFRFTGTATTARVITLPDASGTMAVSASGNIALDSAGNITFTGQLPIASGGTGASSAQAAINNLSGLTTNGDLLYNDGTNSTRLARGSTGDCLLSNATTILWGSCAGSGTTFFTLAGTTGTPQNINGGDTLTIAAGSNISTAAGATDTVTVSVISNPTFSGTVTASAAGTGLSVTNNATIGGTLGVQGATLTVGSTTQAGSLVLNEDTNNNTVTINTGTQATGSYAVSFPTLAANDTFCLVTVANCAGSATTLQASYDADTNGSDTRIDLTANDDSLVISNPASSGTDSTYVLKVEQLNTGALDALQVTNSGTGNIASFQDAGTLVLGITDGGNLVANNSATGTTGTTTGTGTNTTTLALTSDPFGVNDVVYIDNAGQDFVTRITADPGTNSYTVSPAVTFEAGRTVTKYNVQNIGATTSDYTTLSNRFFQGYFLGGVVAGTGSTTLSDQRLSSTGALNIASASSTTVTGGATSNIFKVDADNLTTGNGLSVTSASTSLTSGYVANLNQSGAYTGVEALTGSVLNVSRAVSSNNGGSVTATRQATTNNSSASGASSRTFSHTVTSQTNQVLLVSVETTGTNAPSSVTFNGSSLTMAGSAVGTNTVVSFWYLVNPTVTTANVVITMPSSVIIYAHASNVYNVDQATPVSDVKTDTGTTVNPTLNVTSTSAGDLLFDAYAHATNAGITAGGGQTGLFDEVPTASLRSRGSTKPGAAGTVTMSENGGATNHAYIAVNLKAASALGIAVTGAAVNLTSNCTVLAGTCYDSAPVVNIAQSYSAASGSVLKVTNAGTGNIGEFIDGSTTVFKVADGGYSTFTANGSANAALTVNNASGTGNIINIQDNGTNILTVADGGTVTATGSGVTTGSAMVVQGNSLTSGSALNVSSSSANLTSGNVLNVVQNGTYTAAQTITANTVNLSRSVTTSSASVVVTRQTTTNSASASAGSSRTFSHTVTAQTNQALIVTVETSGTNVPTSVTFNGTNLTMADSAIGTNTVVSAWYLANPAVTTANIVITMPSSVLIYAHASNVYNVDQSTPISNTQKDTGTTVNPTLNVTSTSTGDLLFDAYAHATNAGISPGAGQTGLFDEVPTASLRSYGSTKAGASGTVSMSENGGATNHAYLAFNVKLASSPGIVVTGAATNISSNCTASSGSCYDSSTVLNVAQSFSGATGSVLKVTNAGTGNIAEFVDGTTTVFSVADGGAVSLSSTLLLGTLAAADTNTYLCRNSSNVVATCNVSPLSSALTDNVTNALDIQEGTNNYININTTNGSENISFGNATTNPSYNFLGAGTVNFAGDLFITDGTDDFSAYPSGLFINSTNGGAVFVQQTGTSKDVFIVDADFSGSTGIRVDGTITATEDIYSSAGYVGSELGLFVGDGSTNYATIGFAASSADVNYNFPAASAGTYSICTSTGNCGSGPGVLVQVPTSTAQNTVTPTTNSVVGLTVNGTSGTAATALAVAQTGAANALSVTQSGGANAVNISNSNTSIGLSITSSSTGTGASIVMSNTTGTATAGLSINRSGAGGTTTSLLALTNTAGTATNGILFTGTIGTDITSASARTLTINSGNNASGVSGDTTVRSGSGTTGTGALTLSSGDASSGTAGNISVDVGNSSSGSPQLNIGTGLGSTGKVINIGSTSQTGTITVGQSTATNTISIGSANGINSTQTINIGNGTSSGSGGKIVNIANSIPGSSTTNTVNIANAGTSTGAVSVNIGSNGSATHTLNLLAGGSGGALNINTSGANINIGTSSFAYTTTLGNQTSGSQVNIQAGSGVSIDGLGATTYTIGGSATTGTITLGSTIQTGTITIGRASNASNTINIGAAAGNTFTQTINVGTSGTLGSTTNVTIGSTVAGTTTIQGLLSTTNAVFQGTNALVFEGSSADANETTIAISNPTADRTITLPNQTGTVVLDSTLTTEGDIYYRDGTGLNRLARGTNGQCLTANATTILWGTCGAGVSAIGTFDGQTPNANGGVISGGSLYFQSATASVPGLVNTGTQAFAGNKTLTGNFVLSGGSSYFSNSQGTFQGEAFGNGAATSIDSVAVGFNASATNNSAIAIGSGANASTISSGGIAIGAAATSTGGDSVIIGHSASGTSEGAISIGYQATAGYLGIAIGYNVTASGSESLNIGDTIYGDLSNDRIAVGTSTTSGGRLTVDNAASTDAIFVAKDNGTAVFTIADGGQIQIESTAGEEIHFTGTNHATIAGNASLFLQVDDDNNSGTEFVYFQDGGNNTFLAAGSGGELTLGTSFSDGLVKLADGSGQYQSILTSDVAADRTYTIPATTSNDTFCLVTLANCSGSAVFTDAGAFSYLTTTTDDLVIGASTQALANNKLDVVDAGGDLNVSFRSASTGTTYVALDYDGAFGAGIYHNNNTQELGLVSNGGIFTLQWFGGTFNRGLTVNEDGGTDDFRVESNNNTHLIYADGTNDKVSIGGATNTYGTFTVNGGNINNQYASTFLTSTLVAQNTNPSNLWVYTNVAPTTAAGANNVFTGSKNDLFASGTNFSASNSYLYGANDYLEVGDGSTASTLNVVTSQQYSIQIQASSSVANYRGTYISNPYGSGSVTNASGVTIEDQTKATNNTNLLIGAGIQSGNWSIYNGSSKDNYFGGPVYFAAGATSTTQLEVRDGTSATVTLFVIDSTNDRVYIGDTTADSTGVTLVLDSKNTSGDPTGVNGAMYYNSNMGKFRCYENGVWTNCSDPSSIANAIILHEDFFSQNVGNSNTIGTHGWLNDNTGCTAANLNYNNTDDPDRPGVLNLSTGGSATGCNSLRIGFSNSWRTGGNTTVEMGVRVTTLSTATEEYDIRLGLSDNDTGQGTDGIYWEYDRNGSTNWRLVTAAGGTRTKVASTNSSCGAGGTPVAVTAGSWVNLKYVINSNATQVDAYINDVFVGCSTTNIPTGTQMHSPQININKTAGTTSRDFDIDFFSLVRPLTTKR